MTDELIFRHSIAVCRRQRARIDPGIGEIRDAADLPPLVKWLCGSTEAIFR